MNLQLPEQMSSALENMDDKTRHYIFGGILLVFFLLDFFIFMQPQIKTLQKTGPEIKTLLQESQRAKNNMQRLDFFRSEVQRLKGEVVRVNKKLRSHQEIPLILEMVSQIANQNGIRIDQIMPETQEMEILLEEKQRKYFSLPIHIKADGGYHDFGRFLNAIEKGEISLNIEEFLIKENKDDRRHILELTFKAVVYEEVE